MRKRNKDTVQTKKFIIPLLLYIVAFSIVSYGGITGLRNYYFDHMKEHAINLARGYSQTFSKGVEANEIVNQLLEGRILAASKTIASYTSYSNQLLEELAYTLEVDEINVFSPKGKIEFSNMNEYIGLEAYEGEPVYEFMKSNATSLVEDIRPSTDEGINYKYGYFQSSDGGFVQIGVLADRIKNFLTHFETKQLLHEIQEYGLFSQSYFINNDLTIVDCTNEQHVGQKFTDDAVIEAIRHNQEYGSVYENDGETEYHVFVPIYSDDIKIGTLGIVQSLKSTETAVLKITITVFVTVIIIFILIFLGMISTNRKNNQLVRLAYYDPLTGLPNIQYLKEQLAAEIDKKKENTKALIAINFCDFKTINVIYGYSSGDLFLKKVSQKLQCLVDDNIQLFRLSDDQFIVYVENYLDDKELMSTIYSMIDMFNQPLKIGDIEHSTVVHLGIVEIDERYNNVDQLLKDAAISLSYIKNNYSASYVFFNKEMESVLQRVKAIENELRAVIDGNHHCDSLYLEYQPLLDLKTNKIVCFEALARLKTERLGAVSPIEFIDVAERQQLIVPLGNLIIRKACEFIKRLKAEGHEEVKVAVNVSGIQLLQDSFVANVLEIMKEVGVAASNLELEITESVLLDKYDVINEKLTKLRDEQISVSLDDFGTGYSSFSRLAELSIDTVKIDRYFTKKIPVQDDQPFQITGDIISMAHKLGYNVVAEGVELPAQREYLHKTGCDIIQGYLFSKPQSEQGALELLKKT